MSGSQVTLEVTLHEDERYAEWEMWREWPESDNLRASEWITKGTAPSLESAIDKALLAWLDSNTEREP